MRKIGKKNSPDLKVSLNKYIKAEDERRKASYRRTSVRDFTGGEWADEGYEEYWDDYYDELYGSKPWWADYGLEDDATNDDGDDGNHKHAMSPSENDDDEFFEYYSRHANDEKRIYFYPDVNYKWDKQEFKNLKEFNQFCTEMGYLIEEKSLDDLMYCYESHCCLDPAEEKEGNLVVVCDRSYGALSWTVSDDDDEFNFYS